MYKVYDVENVYIIIRGSKLRAGFLWRGPFDDLFIRQNKIKLELQV